MKFFKPEDFRKLMNKPEDDEYLCLVAADKANAKLERVGRVAYGQKGIKVRHADGEELPMYWLGKELNSETTHKALSEGE